MKTEQYAENDCDRYDFTSLGSEYKKLNETILNKEMIDHICREEAKSLEKQKKENNTETIPFVDACPDITFYLIYKKGEKDCSKWTVKDTKPKVGMYGSAYQSTCDDDKEDVDYVLKIDKYGYNCKEVFTHLKLERLGVAPKLYEVWLCKNAEGKNVGTVFIMEKLYRNFDDLIQKVINENEEESKMLFFRAYPQLVPKLKLLYDNDINHNDIHYHNLMVDKNGELYFIDFGLSSVNQFKDHDDYLKKQLMALFGQIDGDLKAKSIDHKDISNFDHPLVKFRTEISRYAPDELISKRTVEIGGKEEEDQRKIDDEKTRKMNEERREREAMMKEQIENAEIEERVRRQHEEEQKKKEVMTYSDLINVFKRKFEETPFDTLDLTNINDIITDFNKNYKKAVTNLSKEDKTKLMTLVSTIKRLNDKTEILGLFSTN